MRRVLTSVTVVGLAAFAMLVGSGEARADSYNLMGFEGVPTLESGGFTLGTPPPVGDYATTLCRYIDVVNTTVGHYYLRYFLDLPDGATITGVSLRIADYNPTGVAWVYLRSRPWNSRAGGDLDGLVVSSPATQSDQVLNMPNLDLEVDNTNRSYWIDVASAAADAAGELCVYSIHVVYIPRLFADGFESGDTGDWSSANP